MADINQNPEFDFNMLSLNVRGIRNNNKREAVYRWIKRQKADIIFLQETYSNHTDEIIWEREWGGKVIFVHGSKHSCGLMVLFDKALDFKLQEIYKDPKGRYILTKALIQETPFYLLNIYAPNKIGEQISFFEEIKDLLLEQRITKDDYLLMGGDFNVTLDPTIDKSGGSKVPKSKSLDTICNIKEQLNLQDIWRIHIPISDVTHGDKKHQ